jgi:hypothetical protein
MTHLQLTDDQQATVDRIAGPLSPWDAGRFRERVAALLISRKLDDAAVFAAAQQAQRELLNAPPRSR